MTVSTALESDWVHADLQTVSVFRIDLQTVTD